MIKNRKDIIADLEKIYNYIARLDDDLEILLLVENVQEYVDYHDNWRDTDG